MKQLGLQSLHSDFQDYWRASGRQVHGGMHSLGKRKTKRPLDMRRPIHIVMRSSLAKGERSLKRHSPQIKGTLEKFAQKFGVRIYKYSNNSNHLHLLVKAAHRDDLKAFMRTTLGLIARIVLKSKKGRPSALLGSGAVSGSKSGSELDSSLPRGRFWDHLVFTRVAHWGKAYKNLQGYVVQNILEAAGVVPYRPRKTRYAKLDQRGQPP